MNEYLVERFGRQRRKYSFQQSEKRESNARSTPFANLSLRDYFKASAHQASNDASWLTLREIPASNEVFDAHGSQNLDQALEITENIIVGPYESKQDYLERHYNLLREDAVAPLREAIQELQMTPYITEVESQNQAYLYEKVFITGLTFATQGIAARVTFSLRRVGKKVNWDQSKRLLTGALVALTPVKEPFKSICHVAVVAARPLAGLQQNPPELDLFFGGADELEIDPHQEWLMVESRNGFFEGHRHVLLGLQKLAEETFPLAEHIVDIQRKVPASKYVQEQPVKNLSTLFASGGQAAQDALNVNILQDWPSNLPSELDDSQTEALRRILTKQIAIVHGPPGTGKTHVSVLAIRSLLQNMAPGDPPLIISAHTNHALDQLLRHISKFEPSFIRLGSFTKDMEIIKPRTLFKVKEACKQNIPQGSLRRPALHQLKVLAEAIIELLKPLAQGDGFFTGELFKKYGVLSEAQHKYLAHGATEWVNSGATGGASGDVSMWLGDERVEAKQRTLPEDFGIEIEEVDLEFEQLKELEAESKLVDDDDHESLRGKRVIFSDPWTGRRNPGITQKVVKEELAKTDMWDIPAEYRGSVYQSMREKAIQALLGKVRGLAKEYTIASRDARIGLWEIDHQYLKEVRVVGMTTTGLSKYRGLINSLDPKIVLIEEAAETLEGPIAVACFQSLQQLSLVGDHQQLRASVNDEGLAGDPFYLGVSMFERLVRNQVEFTRLNSQRRMIPEIRRALKPIYSELEDHPSVKTRPPIAGMGGINSFFFVHKGREATDSQMSKINEGEADMIVAYFRYLVQNGVPSNHITVLTFYNGQRKLILRKLKGHSTYGSEYLNVVTVDSYQGEENDVVLLSLVRSNEKGTIGFLDVENRICVAISRARRGFYLFGDAPNLCRSSMLWYKIVKEMAEAPCRVGFYMHLTCENHGNKTFVKEPHEFAALDGGCLQHCGEKLPCGHDCLLQCHPFRHDIVVCKKPCERRLPCGCFCTDTCSADGCKSDCDCATTTEDIGENIPAANSAAVSYVPPNAIPQARIVPKARFVQEALTLTPTTHVQEESHRPLNAQTLPFSYAKAAASPASKGPKPGGVTPTKVWQSNLPQRNRETGEFQSFAEGGYIESDRKLAELAEQENAVARQKQLDEENWSGLFGETKDRDNTNILDQDLPDGWKLAKRKKNKKKAEIDENVKLVRTKDDGRGGNRGVWKGNVKWPEWERSAEKKGGKGEDRSLLDL